MKAVDRTESDARTRVEVVDFSSPVQGRDGAMYPLTSWRAEEVDLDFVLDIGEDELVVASDLAITSGGKGAPFG
ncbi:hypothetical protein [Stenotrophomonas rhizophila]